MLQLLELLNTFKIEQKDNLTLVITEQQTYYAGFGSV